MTRLMSCDDLNSLIRADYFEDRDLVQLGFFAVICDCLSSAEAGLTSGSFAFGSRSFDVACWEFTVFGAVSALRDLGSADS